MTGPGFLSPPSIEGVSQCSGRWAGPVCARECSGSRQIVLEEKSEKNGNPGPFARFIDSRITVLGYIQISTRRTY